MRYISRPRPVDRDRSRKPGAFKHALACSHKFISFAAVNLPTSFPDPLSRLKLDFDLDLPFFGSDEPAVSRRKLRTVGEFFKFTDEEDAAFFALLDRDSDGKVTVDDLKDCLRKRNLPAEYAQTFLERARGGRWWARTITFAEFKSLVDDNESKVLRAFSLLETDAKGSLDLSKMKGSLAKLDLPATDSNARAMLRALGKAEDASIAYGEFRRFAILMPRDKLLPQALNLKWFESATCVPIGGTAEQGVSTGQLLLKAALAGGLSSGCSTLLMHPLDTLKTRIQSIPGATIGSVVKGIPRSWRTTLYRGIIPAGAGAFSSHGVRTCAYEAGLIGMSSLGFPFLQAQPLASLLGTVVGTVVRIPCEVLKQQLQRGNQDNVRMALSEISRLDGTKGFFRGAGALMFREVPFYVAGMVLYEQFYKPLFNGTFFGTHVRQLSTAETIAIGALAGASASFISTPADVVKSRLMTTMAGSNVSTTQIVVDLIQKEGFLALFKGALFRAVWIAPLGAMNFAGYELAKRAMGVSRTATLDSEQDTSPRSTEDVMTEQPTASGAHVDGPALPCSRDGNAQEKGAGTVTPDDEQDDKNEQGLPSAHPASS